MKSQLPDQAAGYDWLTYPEGARYLACTERQLRRWVTRGRIGHTRLGLRALFTKAQLDAFVAATSYSPAGDRK